MSPKWAVLAFCLLIAPSLVAPQIGPGTIISILCVISRGVFVLNGCMSEEKFLCRLINLKFRFFCQSFPCTLYGAPPERRCTGLLFQCPVFDVLPFGICPLFRICCNSGGSNDSSETTVAFTKKRKPSETLTDTIERPRKSPLPKWLQVMKPKTPNSSGNIWQVTLLNFGKTIGSRRPATNEGKVLTESNSSKGDKSTSKKRRLIDAKLLTDTIASVGKQFNSKIGGKILTDTLSNIGEKLSSDQLAIASKLLTDTISSIGGQLTPNQLVSNGKLLTETILSIGGKLTPNQLAIASKLLTDSISSIGGKLTPNQLASNGKLLTETILSIGEKLNTDKLPAVGGKILKDTLSAGRTLTSTALQSKAGKAISDTVFNVGGELMSHDIVANTSKALLDLISSVGGKFNFYRHSKRGKRSVTSKYSSGHYAFLKNLVDDKYGELSSHEDVPEEMIRAYTKDWPSDETNMVQVELAIEREYEKLMVEIDMANSEIAVEGGQAIEKITFEEFRVEILGDQWA